jgi:hypothetical protein
MKRDLKNVFVLKKRIKELLQSFKRSRVFVCEERAHFMLRINVLPKNFL